MLPILTLMPMAFDYIDGWSRLEKVGRRLQAEDPDSVIVFLIFSIWGWTLVLLSERVLQLIFMLLYKGKVSDKREQVPTGLANVDASGDFQSGVCACFDEMNTCLHGFFCFSCRAADTLAGAGLAPFYTVIMIVFLFDLLGYGAFCAVITDTWPLGSDYTSDERLQAAVSAQSSVASLCYGLYFANYRQQLREKLGSQNRITPWVMDFLCWWCCSPCVACQEAREFDKAMGVTVSCCCNMSQVGGGIGMVGQPVMTVQGQPQQMQGQLLQNQAMMMPPVQPQMPVQGQFLQQ